MDMRMHIERVDNGFVVNIYHHSKPGFATATKIAATPKEVSEIARMWAESAMDEPKITAKPA